MKRLILLLLLVAVSLTAADIPQDTDRDLIIRALRCYLALQEGTYQVKTISTAVSNGRHWLRQELHAGGQVFRWTMSFPVIEAKVTRANAIILLGGNKGAFSLYSRQIWGSWSILAGPGFWDREAAILGGISVSFGK